MNPHDVLNHNVKTVEGWYLPNGKPYSGYIHRMADGRWMTGNTHEYLGQVVVQQNPYHHNQHFHPAESSFEAGFYPNYTGTWQIEGKSNPTPPRRTPVIYYQVGRSDVYRIYINNENYNNGIGDLVGVVNCGDVTGKTGLKEQYFATKYDYIPGNTFWFYLDDFYVYSNPNYRPIPGLYPWCKHSRFIVEYKVIPDPINNPNDYSILRLDCSKAHYTPG